MIGKFSYQGCIIIAFPDLNNGLSFAVPNSMFVNTKRQREGKMQ